MTNVTIRGVDWYVCYDWLKANLQAETWSSISGIGDAGHLFSFDNPEDALAFRLVFGK